jgi:RNA polymerase sigma factor (sigma-70 family)
LNWLRKEHALARDDATPGQPAEPISFTEVVNEHWSSVYRLLYCMTGSIHDTEDLTQETFLRALKRIETFQAGTRMRAWLLRIAANAFFDAQRSRRRGKTQPLPEDLAGTERPPGQALETAEQSELLQAALVQLSNTDRMVFHLRVQEELSHREIAETLGISEEAARWHLHQARAKLLKWFKGKYDRS